jgi:hypothetical protein
LPEDPQVWRGDRQGDIALIHSAPTPCCDENISMGTITAWALALLL